MAQKIYHKLMKVSWNWTHSLQNYTKYKQSVCRHFRKENGGKLLLQKS